MWDGESNPSGVGWLLANGPPPEDLPLEEATESGVRRSLLVVAVVTMVAFSGCAALNGGSEGIPDDVAVENDDPGATNVTQTLRIDANETAADSELTAVGATYPRENFTVDAAQHDQIELGIDTDGDGELEAAFNETHISGVNNNEYSFEVTLETDYTLQAGDTVVVSYPAVDNPSEPGDYEIEIRLNDEQNATDTVTID
jgi:hypothetical protein